GPPATRRVALRCASARAGAGRLARRGAGLAAALGFRGVRRPVWRELKPLLGMLAHELFELGDDAREDAVHLLDARVPRDGVLGAEDDPVVADADAQREDREDRRTREARETERSGLEERRCAEELDGARAVAAERSVELHRDDLVPLERAQHVEGA